MLIAFVGDFGVPLTIDGRAESSVLMAVMVNVLLLALFGLQHRVMARPGFKQRLRRFVADHLERSTYVLVSSALLALIMWQWQPIPAPVWEVTDQAGRILLYSLFGLGWAMVFASTFLIDHFDFFGLKQVYAAWRRQPAAPRPFTLRFLYKLIRHPLMLGFLIAFWATPVMSQGHLLFAAVMTLYILIGLHFEERDPQCEHGGVYGDYRRQVPMLPPLPRRPTGQP